MHLQLIELEADLKRLKACVRRADKIAHKRDVLLPKWLPVVKDYLASLESSLENNSEVKPYDHPIFAYCTIWLFDISDLSGAISFGLKAIEYGQPMAPGIRRKWPSFIADTVFDWAQTEAEHGNSVEPYFTDVFEHVVNEWVLPEQVTAKFYKFAGLALLRSQNGDVTPSRVGDVAKLKKADQLLAKAADLHKHAQVKTVRNRIAMRIRALEELGQS